jgi:serine/threonine protein kinase
MGECAGTCSGTRRGNGANGVNSTIPSATTTMTKSIMINPSQFVREITANFKDHYVMGKKLGGGTNIYKSIGAYGQVYTCTQKSTQLIRAVKVMEKSAIDEDDKERFFAEIKILKIMDHPNIVLLYEVFEDESRYYLVTE